MWILLEERTYIEKCKQLNTYFYTCDRFKLCYNSPYEFDPRAAFLFGFAASDYLRLMLRRVKFEFCSPVPL